MPDIEGVPYETTGTPLDQASAQALAARHREVASAGINAAAVLVGERLRAAAQQSLTYSTVLRARGEWSQSGTYHGGDVVTSGGAYWYAAAGGGQQAQTRENHVYDPRFTAGLWTPRTGSTVAIVDGRYSLTAVGDVANGNTLLMANLDTASAPGALPGDVWSVAADLTVPAGSPALTLRIGVQYGAATPYSMPSASIVTVEPGQTVRAIHTGSVTPDGKTTAGLVIRSGALVPTGSILIVSNPIMERGQSVGEFFHGSTLPTAVSSYSWVGVTDRSASVETTVAPVASGLGTPGEDPQWVQIGSVGGGGATPETQPLGDWSPAVLTTAPGTYPGAISNDRMTLYNENTLSLSQSRDEGQTWQAIPGAFGAGQAVGSTTQLQNGELLVITSGSGEMDTGAAAWVSNGYDPLDPSGTTWTKAEGISDRARRIRFTGSWSISTHGPIILLAEYGPKQGQPDVLPGEHARYVYLSTDYGRTWSTIFDLDTSVPHDAADGHHVHGVAWDPYWDRIWLTWGDNDNGVAYSDDLGETWQVAYYWGQPQGKMQAVGIVSMEKCILFGSDDTPNGVYRIDRSEGKNAGAYTLEVAYRINDSTSRTHLCHAPYLSSTGVAYFPFGMEDVAGYPCIAATRDGYTWETIWTSDYHTPAGRGLRRVLGPTIRGNLIATANDGRDPNYGISIYRAPALY